MKRASESDAANQDKKLKHSSKQDEFWKTEALPELNQIQKPNVIAIAEGLYTALCKHSGEDVAMDEVRTLCSKTVNAEKRIAKSCGEWSLVENDNVIGTLIIDSEIALWDEGELYLSSSPLSETLKYEGETYEWGDVEADFNVTLEFTYNEKDDTIEGKMEASLADNSSKSKGGGYKFIGKRVVSNDTGKEGDSDNGISDEDDPDGIGDPDDSDPDGIGDPDDSDPDEMGEPDDSDLSEDADDSEAGNANAENEDASEGDEVSDEEGESGNEQSEDEGISDEDEEENDNDDSDGDE